MLSMIRDLRLPGHPDPVLEILTIFDVDTRSVLAELDRARRTGDLGAIRRGAHRLKGAASNLGASGMVELLTTIERAALAGDVDGAGSALAELPDVFERTLRTLYDLSRAPGAGELA